MLTLEDIKEALTVAQYAAFIENLKRESVCLRENKYRFASLPSEAIFSLFIWEDSPEGVDYWRTIYNHLHVKGL